MEASGNLRPRLAQAAVLGLLCGCSSTPTQVLVWIEAPADSMVAQRASHLRVIVHDGAGATILDEVRRLRGDAPLLALPASISLVPQDGDPTRLFEVEARLLEGPAGAEVEIMRQLAEGQFVADEVRELRLRFDDQCLGVSCGEGRSCIEGVCRRACYAATPIGEVTRSSPTSCPCRCACEGDVCRDGDCVPALPAVDVSAGHAHACALGQEGQVWCWGAGGQGRLGVGDTQTRATPVRVDLPPASAVGAGPDFSCAVLVDGTVRCFGAGARGQLGFGVSEQAPTPRPLLDGQGQPLSDVVAIGLGGVDSATEPSGHACAVRRSGDVYCWGQNEFGMLGAGAVGGVQPPSRVMTTLAGDDMATVDLGGFHSCARQRIGRLWCWGRNHDWQLGFLDKLDRAVPEQVVSDQGFSSVIDIAAGTWHSCAVAADGGLWCWGEDADWRLGLGDGVEGDDVMVPTRVPGEQKWASVDAGHRHTCAIDTRGELWCFGTSAEGESGVRARSGQPSSPLSQLKDQPWLTVALGTAYTCGIRSGGALYCWGRNDDGQLGIGTGPSAATPARVCLP